MRIIRKSIASLTLILMTLMASQSLFGQDDESSGSKFGLGVSLFNLTEYLYEFDYEPTNSVYMTIDIGSKFRLEPTLGFVLADGLEYFSFGIGAF